MAYGATLQSPGLTLGDRVARWRDTLAVRHRQNAAYRQTFNELSALTDRELADIGVASGQIDDIAREAARLAA